MIHKEESTLAGQVVKIKDDARDIGGREARIEDWWDRVSGGSWMNATGNPACLIYAMRSGLSQLPTDNEVLYGKINGLGYLIHVSEIEADNS